VTIDTNMFPTETDFVKSHISIRITPKQLFDLLRKYNNKTLHPIYSFKFTEREIKTSETQLVIELKIILSDSDSTEDVDTKICFLEPKQVFDAEISIINLLIEKAQARVKVEYSTPFTLLLVLCSKRVPV
jgi:hypothetical protein